MMVLSALFAATPAATPALFLTIAYQIPAIINAPTTDPPTIAVVDSGDPGVCQSAFDFRRPGMEFGAAEGAGLLLG